MHFSDPVMFEVPVYPRTQKYIRAKLKDDQGNPYPLIASPFSQGISLHLWLTAQSKKVRMVIGRNRSAKLPATCRDKSGYLIAPTTMTATIGLGIDHFHPSRHQYLLNYQELEQFCNYVDVLIFQEMVGFCQAAPEVLPVLRIAEFTQLYGFTEQDFSQQSLRSGYRRYAKTEAAIGATLRPKQLIPSSSTER
jgi:hypothetical protein